MSWKTPELGALMRLQASAWSEAKTELAKGGLHNRFEADFELRFVLFLAENIDGLSNAQEKNFAEQISKNLEWSTFHLRMLNDRVHRLPSFDLDQLRLCHEYPALAKLAYQFALSMCLIDGSLNRDEELFLQNLSNSLQIEATDKSKIDLANFTIFGMQGNEVEAGFTTVVSSATDLSEKSLQEYIDQLDQLTGLASVKAEIKRLVSFLDIQKQRAQHGLPVTQLSLHMVFTGSPGTGKTTVARLVASIYKAMGILKMGHLVETDRSGLVGQYVGHTEVKTNTIINKALDGILFIDEAYALVKDSENDFGQEAIDALVKRLEDDRHRLVVIVAGYSDEMQKFLRANPGLTSRFNTFIAFEDFSSQELIDIFKRLCEKNHYQLHPTAMVQLEELFKAAITNAKGDFGNARYARNLFEGSLRYQAFRLSQSKEKLNREDLMTLTASDLTQASG